MSSPEAPAPTRPSVFGRFFWKDPNTQFLLLAAAVGVAGAAEGCLQIADVEAVDPNGASDNRGAEPVGAAL